jgi:hypothetical protein
VNGGTQARWRHDGRELFYIDLAGNLIARTVTVADHEDAITFGPPVTLFQTNIFGGPIPGARAHQYTVTADGQRFLINSARDVAAVPISLILNWNPRR